jgi:hypothetical protein
LVQGEQRNKWQGPAEGGKDAVYAGCEIEPTEWSATRSEIRFSARLFSDSLPPFSVFACSAVQSFGPSQRLLSIREQCARFKLLSAGAGSKHGDLCNEQIRDSNERSNLSLRVLFAQAPFQTRSVAAKKFICGLALQIQWPSPFFFGKVRGSLLFGGVHNQT